ncbi:hypothetical protein BKA58DRAFT_91765 [Alternaria rosae]|uniref:uncharacterized protein n=1 Tax=Alternaria rosae TaxID=1187941 RepID=UPI001E8ED0FC|nr:uncharacterized protein BKA58DRAFT_91765 [Alternaria rosae]KAH6878253.1 hypothetical protein BKA58DRAFT_91765 [Alternaria rosae]
MSDRYPVKRWLCCNCGGSNNYVRDLSCAHCYDHSRSSCCFEWADANPESQLFDTLVSQPRITATPSTSSSISRSAPVRRPVISQSILPNDQKYMATTVSKPGTFLGITQDRSPSPIDLFYATPDQATNASSTRELSRTASKNDPVTTKAPAQFPNVFRTRIEESRAEQSTRRKAFIREPKQRQNTLKPPVKTSARPSSKSSSKPAFIVQHPPPRVKAMQVSSKDDGKNNNPLVSQERIQDKRKASPGPRAHMLPTIAPRIPSRTTSSRLDMSIGDGMDTESLEACDLASGNANGEIRLLVDTNTLSSLRIDGDFEGHTMEINPAEDGMTELVISSSHDPRYQARHNTASVHEAGSVRNRRLSAHLPPVEAGDLQGSPHTGQAKFMPNSEKRDPRVYYRPPAALDDSSDDYFTEDEISEVSIAPRRRGAEQPPPRQRRVVYYDTAPRPTRETGYRSGPAIIQPAIGTGRRRPTTATARRMSYTGEPRSVYHSQGPPRSHAQPSYSARSARHSEKIYVAEFRNSIERASVARVAKERPLVSQHPVHATGNQTSSPQHDERQHSMRNGERSGYLVHPMQPTLHLLPPSYRPIPSRHDPRLKKVPAHNFYQRDDVSSQEQAVSEPCPPPREAQDENSSRPDSTCANSSFSPEKSLAAESDRNREEDTDDNSLVAKVAANTESRRMSQSHQLQQPTVLSGSTVSPYLPRVTSRAPSFSWSDSEPDLEVFESDAESTNSISEIQQATSSAATLETSTRIEALGNIHIDTWLETGLAGETEGNADQDYGDSISGSSSYPASIASVFSIASLASSASDMSRGSGYSAIQIATATKVLLAIFYEDETLMSLYKSAIENHAIGPARLQRNLRRLFRAYAGLLEGEATERLEYLTSRLVLIKSAMLAQSIVEKLQSGRAGLPLPRRERNEESSDEEENSVDTHQVNEDAFEDLAIFREFLVESEAFKTFRVQLQAFLVPKSTPLTHLESVSSGEVTSAVTVESTLTEAVAGQSKALTWQKWRDDSKQSADGFFGGAHWKTTASSIMFLTTDTLMLATDNVMIAAGLLEPPLRPDMVRLRWRCACGESLHSDVRELRKGGIDKLVHHMRRTSGAKVRASAQNHQSGNQQYIAPHPIQWIRKAVTSIVGDSTMKSSSCLPQHNTPRTATANNPSAQQSILHLLACMHRNRLRKVLQQERIEDVTTDRALLCFMRRQYLRHRSRFLHILSLKSVKGISFVKFRLPIGGSVDVRHHDPCCVTNSTGQVTCECIPPPPKVEPSPGAEYRCIPGPPATYPPIPPVYLASLFTCPTDVHEKDTWILDQLPKRTCGELRGQIGQPAEGWGIYYDEGLDRDTLALTVLLVFIIASLLFGVLWSRFQYDVQGAFGVSAYMVACCAVLLPVIVTRLENKG